MITELSVVIPVYNEQDNVQELAAEVIQALDAKLQYEIIFVDDASQDQTAVNIEQLQQTQSNVRLLRHAHNRGQSAAVVSGVRKAQFRWVATLDGDRQNNPHDLWLLLDKLNQQAHSNVLCMGWRVKRQDNWLRRCSTKIANAVRKQFLKDNCLDSGCGIKIFPRAVFLALPLFKNCHRFLPALFHHAGSQIIYVPVSHRPRLAGQSKYGVMNRLWVGIIDLLGVAWLTRRFIEFEREQDV